jgi:hypothetical protein
MKNLFYLFGITLMLFSCQNDEATTQQSDSIIPGGSTTGSLPQANGEHGQVLVSIETDLWEDDIDSIFAKAFSQNAVGPYIYNEPIFDYINESPKTMTRSRLNNRNFMRIVLEESKTYDETEVTVKENYKSTGQLYVMFRDSDKSRLKQFLKENLKTYIALYDVEENERMLADFLNNRNTQFDEVAKEKFGISVAINDEARFKANKDSIIYALHKSVDEITKDNPATGAKGGTYWANRGVLIWNTPYVNEESMLPGQILATRDSVLKKHVEGTVKGSYMATEYYETHKPKVQFTTINDHRVVLIEGLWKHAGDAAASGGGPFVQASLHHPTNGSVVTVCAYVFAPRFNKREYIREIRTIINTIEVIN